MTGCNTVILLRYTNIDLLDDIKMVVVIVYTMHHLMNNEFFCGHLQWQSDLHSSWKHPDKERATVVAISDVEMESLEDPHREESGLDKYNQYDQ